VPTPSGASAAGLAYGPDAWEVALAAHLGDVPAAVAEYEREMFERTSAAARMSADMQDMLSAPDASQQILAFFQPA
jgi:hypothetical protein